MQRSLRHFWQTAKRVDLEKVIFEAFDAHEYEVLKHIDTVRCRVLYAEDIQKIEFFPYQIHPLSILEIVEANNMDYAYKYANRDALIALKNASQASDVLIVKNGMVTDITYANVAFWDGQNWVTPALPLLQGTKRTCLLKTKKIIEKNIQIADIQSFTKIKIFNAMMERAYDYRVDDRFLYLS
jgi:4-amino-4-deoxychorismate lyase